MTLFALLTLLAVDQAPAGATIGELNRLTPQQLAVRLLPPERATRIVGAQVRRQFAPGMWHVRLWEEPVPFSQAWCRRVDHSIDLRSPPRVSETPESRLELSGRREAETFAPTYPAVASVAACAQLQASWSNLTPAGRAAVETLTTAITEARMSRRLGFALHCAVDGIDELLPCRNARSALATLPLSALNYVSFLTPAQLRTEEIPEDEDARNITFTMAQPAAAPGREIARVHFGPHGPRNLSWEVTLIGDGRRLAEIRLRHAMIIYH